MVTYQAIFTIMHCTVDERMEISTTFQLQDSSDVINGAGVSESAFFFLLMSSCVVRCVGLPV